jgi:hypothetical protein
VRVVGTGDHPLAGVTVEAVPTPLLQIADVHDAVKAITDGEGEAAFADLPYDGTRTARIRADTESNVLWTFVRSDKGVVTVQRGGRPLASETIHGPEVVLRADTGIGLHVDVVSADTGRRVPGARAGAKPAFAGAWSSRHDQPLAVTHGADAKIDVEVRGVPADHVLRDARQWRARIHPAARRLSGRMPLRPEARVYVVFEEPEGMPAGVAWKPRCRLGTTWLPGKTLSVRADAYGRRLLRGVPHIPGEPLRVGGSYGDWGVSALGRLPVDPDDPLVLTAKLTPVHHATVSQRLKLAPFAFSGSYSSGHGGRLQVAATGKIQFDLTSYVGRALAVQFTRGKVEFKKAPKPPPPPRFRVIVLGPDGAPARGAQVTMSRQGKQGRSLVQTTSKKGVATFEGLAPGAYGVSVWGAAAPFRKTVTVPAGGAGSVTLQADHGGEVHVFVVDEDGNPMPFAQLLVVQPSRQPWCDVAEDGEQRVDPFADHLGRRILRNVEGGDVQISATLGTRKGTTTVRVPRGGSAHAEIVLRWPKPKPKPAPKKTGK